MPCSENDVSVTLRNGITVSVSAFTYALDLEDRGIVIRADGDALLVDSPDALTSRDHARIRTLKSDLLSIARIDMASIRF